MLRIGAICRAVLVCAAALVVAARMAGGVEPETSARQALLVDHETGAVLFERNADLPADAASMSKLMTLYLLFERLHEKRLSLTDLFPVSERAVARLNGTLLFNVASTKVGIEDLIRGIAVASANDACVVVAEGIAGSEEAFVQLMNSKARDIGLANSLFTSSYGRPDAGQRMTARDLLTLARRTYVDFPEYYHYFAEKEFTYNGINRVNRNPLLNQSIGSDGLRTGRDGSTYSLALSAEQGGRRVFLTMLGLDGAQLRGGEASKLIQWAFQTPAIADNRMRLVDEVAEADGPAQEERILGAAESAVLEKRLAELGYYSGGAAAGDSGGQTRLAIEAFQRANGFEATGKLTAEQMAELLAPAAAPPAQQAAAGTIAIPDDLQPIDRTITVQEALNLRSEPRLGAPQVGALAAGDSVTVFGRVPGKDWFLVGRDATPLGYVANLQLESPAAGTGEGQTDNQPAVVDAAIPDIPFGRYHALVIGNNDYQSLPKLETAVDDATAVAELLRTRYDFEVEVLVDATRDRIIAGLTALRKRLTTEDNLLIFYAGHGVYDEAADRGYWLPVDADREVPSNWVSNADITDMVKAMQAKHVLIVADSCYSGTLTRGAQIVLQDGGYIGRMVAKRARTALTSGGLEPVLDSGGSGHSVFTRAFIDALTENSGVLDGQQLFSRVREPVVVNADQTPEYGNIRLAGHDGGDFIFVRRN